MFVNEKEKRKKKMQKEIPTPNVIRFNFLGRNLNKFGLNFTEILFRTRKREIRTRNEKLGISVKVFHLLIFCAFCCIYLLFAGGIRGILCWNGE